jgi:hypothetical protein
MLVQRSDVALHAVVGVGDCPALLSRQRTRAHHELAVGTAVQRVARHAVISGGVHSLLRNAGPEIKLRDATLAPITPPNSDSSAGMIGLLHRTRFWVTLLLRLIGSLTVLGRAGDACRALPDRFPRLADYVMLIGIKCGDRRRTPQTTRSSQL